MSSPIRNPHAYHQHLTRLESTTPQFCATSLPPTSNTVHRLFVPAHSRCHGLLVGPHAAVALGSVLVPLAFEAPSAEALVAWVVSSEVTVLNESLLMMATCDEVDLLVEAHVEDTA